MYIYTYIYIYYIIIYISLSIYIYIYLLSVMRASPHHATPHRTRADRDALAADLPRH